MVDIAFDAAGKRAVARDGEKEIGECTFSASDRLWIIDHTQVDAAYGGQGIARRLVDAIVEEARRQGVRLTATCPYAVKVFKEEKYQDIVLK